MTLSYSQYFTSSIIGALSGIMPWGSGSLVLAPTALTSNDEFYDQARFTHQISTIPTSIGMIVAPIVFTDLLLNSVSSIDGISPRITNFIDDNSSTALGVTTMAAIFAGASNLLINEVIMPSITDQIHGFTHHEYDINILGYENTNQQGHGFTHHEYDINLLGYGNSSSEVI